MITHSRRAFLLAVAAAALFAGSYQGRRQLRFELGPGDARYLADPGAFHPPQLMSGPERLPGGRVRESRFGGRLTRERAALTIPYHVVGSAVELRLRCHRFGLGGTLVVSVNGVPIDQVEFGPTSYPWAVAVSTVPPRVARQGPLRIDLQVRGGHPPPAHLPADVGVGLDWVQVRPLNPGQSFIVPTASEALGLLAFLGTLAILLAAAAIPGRRDIPVFAAAAVVSAANLVAPLATRSALLWLWSWPLAALAALTAFQLAYKRRPQLALRVAALTVGIGVGTVTLEGGARLWEGWRTRQPQPVPEVLPLYRENPNGTGSFRLRPGLDLVTRAAGQAVRLRTNRYGMHWREVSEDPGARRRVAFLGDSFTFGCWTPDVSQSFVGVFDEAVRSDGFEALNFGVGGYGLADSELQLREEVLRFQPRYVIVAFYNGNDFRDTYLGLHKDRLVDGTAVLDEALLEQRVPAAFRQADRTTSAPTPAQGVQKLLLHSAAYRLGAPPLGLARTSCEFAVNQRFISYSFWSRQPYPPVAAAARDATLAALGRMRKLAEEHGAQLAVVALPTRDQVCARETVGPDYDIGYPQAYVAAFAKEQRIPYLDLLPLLREHVGRTNRTLYVPGDTHFNTGGHRFAGERIEEWFRSWRSGPGPR